jgi:hypothetical protein
MVVTAEQESFIPPKPPPRWWLRVTLTLVVVAALVAGGLWAREHFLIRCADGVRVQGPKDECVGVTDGAYHFDEKHLGEVVGLIHKENEHVERSGLPWVAVAYVEPMTRGEGDKGWDSIEEELQGAYLAQRELNTEAGGHGTVPQIKLLPANPGSGLRQWHDLVVQILGMTHGKHPVVAVAGFGQSRLTTKRAVDMLRDHGVPMVGSTVTADRLSARDPAGFFRAVSPNSAQSAAVVNHLVKKQQEVEEKEGRYRVQLVKDRNSDDIYSRSLRTGFTEAVKEKGLQVNPVAMSYLSGHGGVNNALASVADKVCDEPPEAVYFAGRGRDLRRFIEAAGADGRRCPVTVFTGDDAVGMFFGLGSDTHSPDYRHFLERWRHSRVSVKYTALAHPGGSEEIYEPGKDEPDSGQNPLTAFQDGYDDVFGGRDGLLNGQAMLGHDAVLAVGVAIRSAARNQGADDVGPDKVLQMLIQIDGDDALAGVSGRIAFDEDGNPRDKKLPLVQLYPRTENAYRFWDLVQP